MKGKISLKDFIQEVKEDLRSALNESDPFFTMDKVTLEVSFGLEIETGGEAKFVVFKLGSKAKAEQTHKVTLELTPFILGDTNETTSENKPKMKRKAVAKKKAA